MGTESKYPRRRQFPGSPSCYQRSRVSGHYANARSYTEWGGGNGNQILARGATHLPFDRPRFIKGVPETSNKE
jgi:hypothetical protein